jgi:CBS domain containing-hemolysin-like protein
VAPLRWVIRRVSDRMTTWIVGPERAPENILQADEVRSLVDDVVETGELGATGRMLINNSLTAGATEIVNIMTPRSRTAFLDADLPLDELLTEFRRLRHLRVPVYRGHRDNLLGFLHVEDVIARQHEPGAAPARVEELVQPPVVVPLTKRVDEMFTFFQRNQARAAAVLNEFGGVAGFITISDVLRTIFGELLGQAPSEPSLVQVGPDTYEAAGDTKLGVFNRLTGFGLGDPRMTTVAGVAFRHLDRLPQVGDSLLVDGLTLTVLEMDAHRIARVRVGRTASGDTDFPVTAEESTAPGVTGQPEGQEAT